MIAAALLLAQVAAPAVLRVRVEVEGERCSMIVAGKPVDLLDAVALNDALAGIDPKVTEAVIAGRAATPYRCVGGIVYALQMRGFTRVAYVGEEASPRPAR